MLLEALQDWGSRVVEDSAFLQAAGDWERRQVVEDWAFRQAAGDSVSLPDRGQEQVVAGSALRREAANLAFRS